MIAKGATLVSIPSLGELGSHVFQMSRLQVDPSCPGEQPDLAFNEQEVFFYIFIYLFWLLETESHAA